MLMFQRFELLLKEIITLSDVQGHPKEVGEIVQKNRVKVSMATLGNLIPQYVSATYSEKSEFSPPAPEREPHVAFSFRIEGEAEVAEGQKRALALVVEERNKLVHQMLGQYQSGSVQSGNSLISALDAQYQMLVPHYRMAEELHSFIQEKLALLMSELRSGPHGGM